MGEELLQAARGARGPNEGLPGNQRAALSLPKGRIVTLTQQWRT